MVPSLEPESTATISAAKPATESSVRPMVGSLFLQTMAMERVKETSKPANGQNGKFGGDGRGGYCGAVNLPVFHAGVRVERVAAGEEGTAWAEAIRTFDQATARVLKRDNGTAVYRATLCGRDVVLKEWELRTLDDRLKALFRASRGHRHWRGAERLEDMGLPTARCFVLATQYGEDSPRQWLVMEALNGKSVLEHMADGDLTLPEERALAAALARMSTTLIANGCWNRDGKPSNLIVTAVDGTGARVAIIDCVAVRRGRAKKGEPARRMYASLVIEPLGVGCPPRRALACRFLRETLDETLRNTGKRNGIPPEETESIIAGQRSVKLWKSVWEQVEALIREHGDPTPRIHPLDPVDAPRAASRR